MISLAWRLVLFVFCACGMFAFFRRHLFFHKIGSCSTSTLGDMVYRNGVSAHYTEGQLTMEIQRCVWHFFLLAHGCVPLHPVILNTLRANPKHFKVRMTAEIRCSNAFMQR